MRALKFPYLAYKGIPCPIVKVALRGLWGWFPILAYVDSGATYSLFSIQLAEEIGLRYARGRPDHVVIGDGSAIPVYLHRLPLRIGPHQLRVTVGFSPRLGVRFNLLGRRDIFSRFDVTFSDSRKTLIFSPVS